MRYSLETLNCDPVLFTVQMNAMNEIKHIVYKNIFQEKLTDLPTSHQQFPGKFL